MRVLHVSRYGSIHGGAETYVRAVCEGLRAAGHDVALVYDLDGDPDRAEVRDGFHVPALATDGVRAAIESFRPDLVHIHVADMPEVAASARRTAPVLLAAHDHKLACPVGTKYWAAWHRPCTVRPGPWCLAYNVAGHCGSLRANATLKPYATWRAANRAARPLHVQAFSEFMRAELEAAGVDRVGVTPYPVPPGDPPLPRRAPEDPRPVVLASGRLNKEKGFHELIDAFGRVRTPAHLVIAGDGHERARLERRAQTSPGPHRITFTGWLEPGRLVSWREAAALVVLPSMWPEPFGIAGIEAMASGKPVVTFDGGGVREWCDDGITGRIVPHGNVPMLAGAIAGLLSSTEDRTRMGAAASSRAAERFSLEAHVTRLLSLYEDVCASR